MKYFNFIGLLVLVGVFSVANAAVDILMMVPDKYGANFNFIHDRFESYGWNVITAGVSATIEPCNGSLPELDVDTLISELVSVESFEALVITSARWRYNPNPYGDLISSTEANSILNEMLSIGKPIWSTCAGARILAAADLLNGINMQGTPGASNQYLQEYIDAGANYLGEGLLPVIDGNIITTTRGQYYQSENCEAILTVLAEKQTSTISSNGSIYSANAESRDAIWTRTFGGAYADGGRALCETAEGGFIITGYTYSSGAGESDVLVLRTDDLGELIWSKTIGGCGWETGNSVCLLPDGGYVIAGETTSGQAGSRDMYLIRLDSSGNILWEKTFGGSGVDTAESVCTTQNGDILVCGYTESFGNGESDIYVVKTDSDGEVLWEKTFGGAGPETGDCIVPDVNNNFLIAGSTGSYTSNRDAFLVQIDSEGELIWSDYYGDEGGEEGYDRATSVCLLSDGGYALAGESNGDDFCGAFLVKADSLGNEIFVNCYGDGFYDYGRDVIESEDGGIIICGSTKSYPNCENDIYLFKTTPDGQLVWEKTFGTEGKSEWGEAICRTSDGNYVILGQTESYGSGGFDVWLIKTDDPLQGVSEDEFAPINFAISPNPTGSNIYISSTLSGTCLLEIYDISGRLVKETYITPDNGAINIDKLSKGMFTARISTADQSASTTFVKLQSN